MASLVGLGKGGSARYHDGRCDHHQGEKLGACRDLGCIGRQAELERLKHAAKLGTLGSFCESKTKDLVAGTRIWRNLAAEPYCAF